MALNILPSDITSPDALGWFRFKQGVQYNTTSNRFFDYVSNVNAASWYFRLLPCLGSSRFRIVASSNKTSFDLTRFASYIPSDDSFSLESISTAVFYSWSQEWNVTGIPSQIVLAPALTSALPASTTTLQLKKRYCTVVDYSPYVIGATSYSVSSPGLFGGVSVDASSLLLYVRGSCSSASSSFTVTASNSYGSISWTVNVTDSAPTAAGITLDTSMGEARLDATWFSYNGSSTDPNPTPSNQFGVVRFNYDNQASQNPGLYTNIRDLRMYVSDSLSTGWVRLRLLDNNYGGRDWLGFWQDSPNSQNMILNTEAYASRFRFVAADDTGDNFFICAAYEFYTYYLIPNIGWNVDRGGYGAYPNQSILRVSGLASDVIISPVFITTSPSGSCILPAAGGVNLTAYKNSGAGGTLGAINFSVNVSPGGLKYQWTAPGTFMVTAANSRINYTANFTAWNRFGSLSWTVTYIDFNGNLF